MACLQTPTPRQPKLRSSCDGCGAAKLRCDRGQPTCGRCLSLGLRCVYGVSRKKGKPPRPKPRSISDEPGSHGRHQQHNAKSNRTFARKRLDGRTPVLKAESVPALSTIPPATLGWGAQDPYQADFSTSSDAPDAFFAEMLGPLPCFGSPGAIHDLLSSEPDTSLALSMTEPWWPEADDIFSVLGPQSSITSPSSPPQAAVYPDSPFGSIHFISTSGHDCLPEAMDILASLHSLGSTPPALPTSPPTPASSCPASSSNSPPIPSNGVTLDAILRLNRDATDRLSRLLTCRSCTRRPHLTLLHAAIISRVLHRYQQAALEPPAPWAPAVVGGLDLDLDPDPLFDHAQASSSTYEFRPGYPGGCYYSPPWWSTTTTMTTAMAMPVDGGGVTISTVGGPGLSSRPFPLSVASTETGIAAIGTVHVDNFNQRVQAAIQQVQLLLGEMRRAGGVIELFISSRSYYCGRGGEGVLFDEGGGVDALYSSLGSWMRKEYGRAVEMMRGRLKDLEVGC